MPRRPRRALDAKLSLAGSQTPDLRIRSGRRRAGPRVGAVGRGEFRPLLAGRGLLRRQAVVELLTRSLSFFFAGRAFGSRLYRQSGTAVVAATLFEREARLLLRHFHAIFVHGARHVENV